MQKLCEALGAMQVRAASMQTKLPELEQNEVATFEKIADEIAGEIRTLTQCLVAMEEAYGIALTKQIQRHIKCDLQRILGHCCQSSGSRYRKLIIQYFYNKVLQGDDEYQSPDDIATALSLKQAGRISSDLEVLQQLLVGSGYVLEGRTFNIENQQITAYRMRRETVDSEQPETPDTTIAMPGENCSGID